MGINGGPFRDGKELPLGPEDAWMDNAAHPTGRAHRAQDQHCRGSKFKRF